jgi:WD40 repeat protein
VIYRRARAACLAAVLLLAACQPTPALPQPVITPTTAHTATHTSAPSPAPSATAAPTGSPTPTTLPAPPPLALHTITPGNAARLQPLAELVFSHWELVSSLAFSPDGSLLAAAVGDHVRLYSFAADVALDSLSNGAPPSLFDPQAAGLLTELAQLPTSGLTHALAFSPDGSWLAAGSRDGHVRLWSVSELPHTLQPHFDLSAHKKGVSALSFTPASDRLATAGNDALTRVWDLSTGQAVLQIVGGVYAVPALAFHPSQDALAIANGALVRVRETGAGRMLLTLRPADAREPWLYSLAFSPDGSLLAAGDRSGALYGWRSPIFDQTAQPEPLTFEPGSDPPASLAWSLAFTPTGAVLGGVFGDGSLRLWDAQTTSLLAVHHAHTRAATALAFHPGGSWLATSGLDARLLLWGMGEGE